jgi:hexosaminidase
MGLRIVSAAIVQAAQFPFRSHSRTGRHRLLCIMKRLLTAAAMAAAAATAPLSADPLPLIPQPVSVSRNDGTFTLTAATGIRYDGVLAKDADLFAADLAKLTGQKPRTVVKQARIRFPSEILIDLAPEADIPAGGYKLEITPQGATIIGKDAAGAFYGTRTLLQLLPPPTEDAQADSFALPCLKIIDYPRFGWRGMHLDVGRNMFPPEDIKGFLDWMAFHKLNTFHWHLTEDQGWRIEIKKYPKLTEIGAWRASTPPYGKRRGSDGKRYGGFYTQDEVRDIVAYAAARHITVVPEIELPGHAAAAIAAYPEFGNDDIPGYAPKVMTRWGVHPYTYAPKEETFEFLDGVFTEICELFPSQYIHIGGDEAPKSQWQKSKFAQSVMKREGLKNPHELQSWFIQRIEKMLAKKGRRLIGWDEIREGGLSPQATVMSWRGEKGGIASAKEGHDVVMAPNSHTYFDHYQTPAKGELAKGPWFECIGGFLPISKVYSYDPVPKALTAEEAKHVLGVQAQLWTEYMHDWPKVEYLAFPRIAALAEVAWTPLSRKDYADFRARLEPILKRYDAAGIKRGEVFDPEAAKGGKAKTKDGSKIKTSLSAYQDYVPEFAFDGNKDTFFWADRALSADDHFTLLLAKPLAAATPVEIATGGPASKNGDKLENGVLEASKDGGEWTKLAEFSDGTAKATAPAGTTQIRLRVTLPQTNWLILHEIRVGE